MKGRPPPGIIEVDIHGMNTFQAKARIDSLLRTSAGAYRIRVTHGYTSGTALREMVRKTYAKNPKVLRLEIGLNQGQTDLVLRELY